MIQKILFIALRYSYGRKEYGEALNKRALLDNFVAQGYEVESVWIDEHEPAELR